MTPAPTRETGEGGGRKEEASPASGDGDEKAPKFAMMDLPEGFLLIGGPSSQ